MDEEGKKSDETRSKDMFGKERKKKKKWRVSLGGKRGGKKGTRSRGVLDDIGTIRRLKGGENETSVWVCDLLFV